LARVIASTDNAGSSEQLPAEVADRLLTETAPPTGWPPVLATMVGDRSPLGLRQPTDDGSWQDIASDLFQVNADPSMMQTEFDHGPELRSMEGLGQGTSQESTADPHHTSDRHEQPQFSVLSIGPAARTATRITPPLPAASSMRTVLTQQIADLAGTAVRLRDDGRETRLEAQLSPPDLGRIRIELLDRGSTTSVRIYVAEHHTLQMLQSGQSELRQQLQHLGIDSDSIAISDWTERSTNDHPDSRQTASDHYTELPSRPMFKLRSGGFTSSTSNRLIDLVV